MDVKTANILLDSFHIQESSSMEAAKDFAHGVSTAFRYGLYNYSMDELSDTDAAKLSKGVRELVYGQGQKVAGHQVAKEQAKVNAVYKQAQAALEQDGSDGGEHSVKLAEGIDKETMSKSQRASYDLAEQIAPAVKADVLVYEGKQEWGYYDSNTDTICLNINAKWSRVSMMTFTLAHELVHRAKLGSPAKFKAFANFLVKEYGKQGSNLDAMIAEQLAAAKKADIKMDPDQAFEEVICDACQKMLVDTDAGKKLAEFGAQSEQNRNIVKQFGQWLKDLMKKLRRIFRNVEPDSLAAQEFQKFDDNVKQILADMFVDMSLDAGEKLSTIKAAGLTEKITTDEGGVKYCFGVTQADINAYIDAAYENNNGEDYVKYAEPSDRLIDAVSDEIDIAGYSHALRDNDIRHIRNSHGENTNEKYPVTKDDLTMIPYIVENYDKVYVKTNSQGKPGIVYVKVGENNVVYYVEAVTTEYHNEKLLVNKQMVKTGFDEIPNLRGLIAAINKKESSSQYLADLQEIRKAYAQGVKENYSTNSIRNSEPNVNNNSEGKEKGPFKLPVASGKNFKNGQNAKGEFVANILIDLADSNSEWWTGRYNRGILGMSKTDDTEFRQFYQEIEKRTKDMEEYSEASQAVVTDAFTVQDGNGKEYEYRVELDGYMHGVVLEKVNKKKFEAALRKETVGGNHGQSDADIKRRAGNARAGMGRSRASDGGRIAPGGTVRPGGMDSGSSRSNQARNDSRGQSVNQTVHDTTGSNDLNGKNKLPIAEDTSTRSLLADDGKDLDIRYKLPVDSEGYDTTNLHWAIENEIISEEDQARFWEAIAEISKRKYNSFARTKNGGYIIENGTKMMFTDGDFKAPTLSKIIDFCYDDGHDIEEARRMIRNEAERTGRTSESLSLIERVYGSWFVAEYDAKDYPTYGRENRRGKGANSERASSESKSWGVRHEGTDSVREGQGLKKKIPVAEDTSPRTLLANVLESLASDDIEKQKIAEYQAKLETMEAEEAKLRELNDQIKELSFAKGKRDAAKIRKLRDEKIKTTNRINIYDKQLLRLEAAKPLQKVLERERKKAYDRAKQKNKEAMAEYKQSMDEKFDAMTQQYREQRKEAVAKVRETSAKRDVRQKILNFKKRMEKRLLRPTDTQYVPAGLARAMVEVCELINTDTDLYKADGSINKAQQRREQTKLRLGELAAEYKKLAKHSDPAYQGEFDETVLAYLEQLRDDYAGKNLSDLTLDELRDMYDILRSIEETLQDAKKLIGWGENEGVYEAGDAIVSEQTAIIRKRKNGKRNAGQKANDANLNNSLSPMRNVERMAGYNQDSMLLKLFKKLERGVRKKNFFTMNAYKSFEELTSQKAYEDTVYSEAGGKKFTDVKGRQFGVSKMQMMQAVLSYERETANNMHHIEKGGFTFADLDLLRKGKVHDAISEENSHRVSSAIELVAEFNEILKDDAWCQAYMKVARTFFNETAKNAINETMLALKHRIVAKDKNYIPFEVDQNFVSMEISAEQRIQQTISAYGMLKETKGGAAQPLYITGLNNIIERHIEMVGNVYGLAVEVRNYNKVWNANSNAAGYATTVKGVMEAAWGKGGVMCIEQAVQDIQGPRVGKRNAVYDKVKSGYIGATFMLNLSVVTKQIGSMFAATSMLNWRGPVRQVANLIRTMANSKQISAEVDQYTATAWMRRQGLSDAELHTLMTEGKKTWVGRLANKLPTWLNPTKWITAMDHAVALSLWEYAKADVEKKTGLEGEALLRATAEFYDEVVENTQSMTDVLHRPEIQKKDGVVAESFAMFKTDLFQMAGQLHTAAGRYTANKTSENGRALGRTVYAVAMSAIWGQLMTTVFALLRYRVDPYRDEEDEDLTVESWLKRQSFALVGDFMGYILPLFGSEVVNIAENIVYGETGDVVDSIGLTAINTLGDEVLKAANSLLIDHEMPDADVMKKLVVKALQTLGVPANNILRTLEAIQLHAEDIANGEFFSFEAGADRSVKQYMRKIVEAVDSENADVALGLYEEAVEELAIRKAGADYTDEDLKEARSQLQTSLCEQYKDGLVAVAVAEEILALLGKSEDEIYWIMDEWDYASENGSSDGYAKYDDFYTAVETGKNLKQTIRAYTDNGVTEETLRSQITKNFKPKYLAMSKSERAGLIGYLLNAYCELGYTREKAKKLIDGWSE